MNGSTSPSILSDMDTLSQRSSSLSSAPSSQPSSGMPLRPSSRLSKEHSHSKDSSQSVVGARRTILSLNSMPMPAEVATKDITNAGSEADEDAVPPRPRSRLGRHRSFSSLKAQPELPFETTGGGPPQTLGTLSPQPPPQPPSPVPSVRSSGSWRRVASTRPSLDESRDSEALKSNRQSLTLSPDQHVCNSWEAIGAPFRHTSLPPLQLDVPQQASGWPVSREISGCNTSRHAEAAAAAARLLCPGPQKGGVQNLVVRTGAQLLCLGPRKVRDLQSETEEDPAPENGASDAAPPCPPEPASHCPKPIFRGNLMRHLAEKQAGGSVASSVLKLRSSSSWLSSKLSNDSTA
ncbi:hypothetical protein DUNSADRAFT_6310 [Dunaliella salina]|uniref:Uncharacterized protein n=1 Tax=Dunaliella salina TaxID=3046 RepID=A0ABQ7GNJ9_DUNSA|nr:hypothetical protein DUNSADRAFT_6310 [Dunaliella salina]|eukprot:KAF5836158.1 hypothetical protein DUNSADRAFT_6310 [Dunaliella salina]